MIVATSLYRLRKHTADSYSVDASDLGIAPGDIPNHVCVEVATERRTFVMVFTRSHAFVYRTPEGVQLVIWND